MIDMAAPRVLLAGWLFVAAAAVTTAAGVAVVDAVGVNWGTMSTRRLPPKVMARLLMDNGIRKVKIFDADERTMTALAGTGIETMVAVPNDLLAAVAADYDRARQWVKDNVTRYTFDGGVNIRFVAVGNEPFLRAYNGSFDRVTVPALKNIQRALDAAAAVHGHGHGGAAPVKVKATVPVNADVYDSPASDPVPSAGRFRGDVAAVMTELVRFLSRSGAPLTVNIYPFLSLYGNADFPLDYAFFDGAAKPLVDGRVVYTNVFDANFDTLVSALKRVGFGRLPVMIGEVGWPTDGDAHATPALAERFYAGLLKRVAARRGTPLRPGARIEAYLFGLVDEDAKSVAPGNFERHWGIFTFDGRPKFPLDLHGDGRPVMPVPARGVEYLPRRWCVLNPIVVSAGDDDDGGRVADSVGYACARADCTALGYGCSCGGALDARGNASYAFNAYYQAQGQVESACDFQGLAVVVHEDPSRGACNFSVQVVGSAAAPPVGAAVAAVLLLPLWFLYVLL